MEQRVQTISEREQVPDGTALRRLMKRDRERREFIRQHFDQDVTDPHLYDLVINLEYVPVLTSLGQTQASTPFSWQAVDATPPKAKMNGP